MLISGFWWDNAFFLKGLYRADQYLYILVKNLKCKNLDSCHFCLVGQYSLYTHVYKNCWMQREHSCVFGRIGHEIRRAKFICESSLKVLHWPVESLLY